ncbi:MAG: hypothetical protein K2G04_06860 [Oscillospiraceae bacterium]|nr:hypothetical protein [Oscillospiraceae bacterium]
MKIKKIIAAVAAAAVVVSTMAISVFADDSYNAYLGVQTNPNWIFRNSWNDGSFGRDNYDNFNNLSKDGAPADIAGTFTDVVITGDGTYKVSLTGADLSSEEIFSLLFISTDIPLDAGVTISNVKVIIDGQTKYTFDEAFLSPDEKTYMSPMAINIWNEDLGKEDGLFGYTMPNDSVEMEFTVSGMGSGAAADTTEAADTAEAPAETTTTTSPTTGNVPAAVMVSVMAVAGTAAVISRKRK